jgi:hypothetical protein
MGLVKAGRILDLDDRDAARELVCCRASSFHGTLAALFSTFVVYLLGDHG